MNDLSHRTPYHQHFQSCCFKDKIRFKYRTLARLAQAVISSKRAEAIHTDLCPNSALLDK